MITTPVVVKHPVKTNRRWGIHKASQEAVLRRAVVLAADQGAHIHNWAEIKWNFPVEGSHTVSFDTSR